jgi:hypothetical protein
MAFDNQWREGIVMALDKQAALDIAMLLVKRCGPDHIREHEAEGLTQTLREFLIDLRAELHQLFNCLVFFHALSSATAKPPR